MVRPKTYKVIYYINNNLVFFHLKPIKNHKSISYFGYKQVNKTFNINIYS